MDEPIRLLVGSRCTSAEPARSEAPAADRTISGGKLYPMVSASLGELRTFFLLTFWYGPSPRNAGCTSPPRSDPRHGEASRGRRADQQWSRAARRGRVIEPLPTAQKVLTRAAWPRSSRWPARPHRRTPKRPAPGARVAPEHGRARGRVVVHLARPGIDGVRHLDPEVPGPRCGPGQPLRRGRSPRCIRKSPCRRSCPGRRSLRR